LIASHGLEHVGSFAKLAAGERRFGHSANQVVDGTNFAEVERLEWNEAVGYGVVQFAVDACAFLVMVGAMAPGFCGTLVFQGPASRGELILTEETIY
jgi:hypothetical protein